MTLDANNRHSREGGNLNPGLPLQTIIRKKSSGFLGPMRRHYVDGGLDSRLRGNDGWVREGQ